MSRPEADVSARPLGQRGIELANERDVLLASIEDLEREHAAGDVDDEDFATLRADYVARAAATLRALEVLDERAGAVQRDEALAPRRRAPRLRRVLGTHRSRVGLSVVGACCVLGLVAIAAAHLAGTRLPGEDASGTVNLTKSATVRQQLEQASILGSEGKIEEAVSLYGTVLTEVPHQPEALTYRGWLIRLAGLADHDRATVRTGDEELADAVRADPSYGDARALYGIALVEDNGQLQRSLEQFRAFLKDKPAKNLLNVVGSDIAAAFVAAHDPVPRVLVAYEASTRSSTTTLPTTTS